MRLRRRKPPDGIELLEAEFLLATIEPRPGQTLEDDLGAAVRSLTDDADRHVLPLFTSEYALERIYPQGSAWVRVHLPDALRLLADGDWELALIDPGYDGAREISHAQAEALLAEVASD